MLDEVLVFFITFLLTYLSWHLPSLLNIENNGPPPTPPLFRSFPLIGFVFGSPHFNDLHKVLLEESDRLGYLIGFYVGRRYAVVFQSRPLVEEAFIKNALDFADRPNTYSRKLFNPSTCGITDRSYDGDFKKCHRLTVGILERFSHEEMTSHMHLVITDTLKQIEEQSSEPFDPQSFIAGSVTSVLWSILFGVKLDICCAQLQQVVRAVSKFSSRRHCAARADVFPPLRLFPKQRREMSQMTDAHNELLSCLHEALDKCLAEGPNRSFVSSYREAEGSEFDEHELLYMLRDIICIGVEMTAATLSWAVLLLANHTDAQQQCQRQIDSVISTDRLPSLHDHSSLPYVVATIHEIMRCKTVCPMSLPRETRHNAYVAAHCIPAGTLVFLSLYALHMDPVVWMEPTEFIPERFLTGAGQLIRTEKIIPYSLGKRSCIGESLARNMVFLFITALLQYFDIFPPKGQSEIDSSEDFRMFVVPFPYNVRLISRKH